MKNKPRTSLNYSSAYLYTIHPYTVYTHSTSVPYHSLIVIYIKHSAHISHAF